MNWQNIERLRTYNYKCGYCSSDISSEKGYVATVSRNGFSVSVGHIYICHKCRNPTFFDESLKQTPGPTFGNPVNHIPSEDVELLFKEARTCYSVGAFTSTVMCCRKLLMNIAVTEGASEGGGFTEYVNYLNENNYIPPNGKAWVDSIRKLGNEANHKIEFRTMDEAKRILNFSEMLLRFIYELPGLMRDSEG